MQRRTHTEQMYQNQKYPTHTHHKPASHIGLSRGILSIFLLLAALCMLAIPAHATPISSQHMTLLAVSEDGNSSVGSTATVTLQLVPGTGEVFINTFPFAKIDTQVSVRLAKEVACDFLGVQAHCDNYNFFYTIETGSSTIGGPSAGSAIAALTVASLDGADINDRTAISGTINSGGVIGAVGGLKEKIDAAASEGIKTVLIPLGERYILDRPDLTGDSNSSAISPAGDTNATTLPSDSTPNQPQPVVNGDGNSNDTQIPQNDSRIIAMPFTPRIDLVEHGKIKGVQVVEVGSLQDAMPYLTGKKYTIPSTNFTVPAFYTSQMQQVEQQLCSRAQSMLDSLNVNVTYPYTLNDATSSQSVPFVITSTTIFPANTSIVLSGTDIDVAQTLQSARSLLNASQTAISHQEYYSAASYCYGAVLNLRFMTMLAVSPASAQQMAKDAVASADVNLTNYQTITDLQTYMLVDERLTEARERITAGDKLIATNQTLLGLNDYATAIERAYSARLWSSFFSSDGNKITLDMNAIADSCKLKIQEATERQNLIGYYTNDDAIGADLLAQAQAQVGKNPVLCLFAASKAKATYDVVLSTLGLSADVFNETFEKKAQIAAQVIAGQFNNDAFPLIGYSYYEYAKSLAPSDPSAALLYIQYALELSNLDAYLSPQHARNSGPGIIPQPLSQGLRGSEILLLGLAVGLLLGVTLVKLEQFVMRRKNNPRNKSEWRSPYRPRR